MTSWANKDEAFADVARQVRKAIEEMNARGLSEPVARFTAQPATAPSRPSANAPATPAQRAQVTTPQVVSSPTALNKLRIQREFSDFDRDEFVHSSFEHIASHFETSLRELVVPNECIKQRFQRFDAQRFTATIYSDGRSVSECTIRIDSMGGRTPNLAFSYNANVEDGSSNEMLSIEHDGH